MGVLTNTTFNDSGYVALPSGATAQRPISPVAGMTRFNTTSRTSEMYNGMKWVPKNAFPYVSVQSASSLGFTVGTSDAMGESDTLTECSSLLTFQEALDYVHSLDARLPTIDELMNEVAAGTGCGFDNEYIWTINTNNPDGSSHYVMYGDIAVNNTSIHIKSNTDTAYVRYVADTNTNRTDPNMIYDEYVYQYLYG